MQRRSRAPVSKGRRDQSPEGDPIEAEPAPEYDFDQSGPEFAFDQSLPDPFDG